jgi:peptide-methionine (S)-S-oxide reductase
MPTRSALRGAVARLECEGGGIVREFLIVSVAEGGYVDEVRKQYLHKVPNGYCGLGGTGISCPVGVKSEG